MDRKHWIFLLLAALVLLFVGNESLFVTDSVESNYALTSKEMVLSGDWLSPQIYGKYWFDKPIFFYWLTALAYKIFGFTDFASRFFPSFMGLAGLGLIAWGGSKLYNNRSGFYSALMLLTCVEFFLISRSIITDSTLFFFMSATLLFFYLGYRDNKLHYWLIMYASSGFATLTKGPIGFLLPGLIIVLFLISQKDWRVLKRCHLPLGLPLFLAVAVPWYYMMYQVHGSAFINGFFGTHNFLRATVSEHSRDNVIYYYTLVNDLAFFPWFPIFITALYRRFKNKDWHFEAVDKFLLIWTFTIFFFFQNMATKYITYTYPMLFPGFLLLGNYAAEKRDCLKNWFSAGYIVTIYGVLLAAAYYVKAKGLVQTDLLFIIPCGLAVGVILYLYLRYKGQTQVYGLAYLALIFLVSLVISIAIPLAEMKSGKAMGDYLKKNNITTCGIYGNFLTSVVYYGDCTVSKLVFAKSLEDHKPKQYSWTAKNVYPFDTLEGHKFTTVLMHQEDVEEFLGIAKKLKQSWKVDTKINHMAVLKKQ